MIYEIDHESVGRLSNALDVVVMLVDRMEPRHWRFPHRKCRDCERGDVMTHERPYANSPASSCSGCIYSHLDPIEIKRKSKRRGRT